MQFDLAHIFHSMGLLSRIIAGVLLVMAIVSIGVTIERIVVLYRSQSATRSFLSRVRPAIDGWDVARVLEIAQAHPRSFVARLAVGIVARFEHASGDNDGGLSAVERARRAGERRREALSGEMRKGLSALATVGSIAPFVGLLGTVVGIISAFQGIGSSASVGLGAVGAGISEALVETAFGLLVAIPAVLCFNFLNTRINSDEAALERFAGELTDEMENEHGRDSGRHLTQKAA